MVTADSFGSLYVPNLVPHVKQRDLYASQLCVGIMHDERNAHYRCLPDWAKVRSAHVERPGDIPAGATLASIARDKNSHRGIGNSRGLTTLFTSAVNQDFLDEICELERLEYLWLGWPVTAQDLSGLARLKNLRFLKLDSPRNVSDFAPLAELPAIECLFIENAKHMGTLEWLAPLKTRLHSLGIEGSMWTMQKIPSLAPLAGFSFEALFHTSVRLEDKNLRPLADCPNLAYLHCARFAPKERFDELKVLRPDIACSWFDRYEI